MSGFIPQSMGWIPDLPDPRDYTYRHEAVFPLLKSLRRSRRKKLPDEVDLRFGDDGEYYFTDPEDQGALNCSSTCAVLSLVEYFERRMLGCTFEGSKLFLYKVTRNRLQERLRVNSDTGADLRTTLKVLVRFGVPPEEHWPYDVTKFDEEPSPFLYGLANQPLSVRYFRLDQHNCDGSKTWERLISFLSAGFPFVFGFPVPTSLTADPHIPCRPELDSIRGGQAAVAVGYRANHFGPKQHALLIRNSWGTKWGDNGNGWLPAAYVRNQLARDFWTVVSKDWLNPAELSRPTVVDAVENTHGES